MSLDQLGSIDLQAESHSRKNKIFGQSNDNQSIIFGKAFEGFYVLALSSNLSEQKTLKIWNEKLDSEEELALSSEKFYKLEQMKECFHKNPLLVLFSSSSILEKSLEVVDLNTMQQKSKEYATNDFRISQNTIDDPNYELKIYEQNHFLFKSKKLLVSFQKQYSNEFDFHDKFLLKNGFAVTIVKPKQSEDITFVEALQYIQDKTPYPISLLFSTSTQFKTFLENASKFPKIERIILSNLEYDVDLEDYVFDNKMTSVLPANCSLMFVNLAGDPRNLFTRKLLAKFREDEFTNQFFMLEYDKETPQNQGSIIINFLK